MKKLINGKEHYIFFIIYRIIIKINGLNLDMDKDTLIAGKSFKKENWVALRENLIKNIDPGINWLRAFSLYETRIKTRLFNPINKILKSNKNEGEGFSIAILQSVLIEHFSMIWSGFFFEVSDYYYKEDRQLNKNAEELGISTEELKHYSPPNTYWNLSSRSFVIKFLCENKPFSEYFTEGIAKKYYNKIRSSLIHTSNTSVDSIIRAKNRKISGKPIEIDNDNIVIFYRNDFQELLVEYFNKLKTMIINKGNKNLRNNLITYLDHATDIKKVWYFAYGSNLSEDRLLNRIRYYHDVRETTLNNYIMKFNKISTDKTGKANIEYCQNSTVKGLCYLIDLNQLRTLDKIEKGYSQRDFAVRDNDNNLIIAKSYYSIKTDDNLQPSDDYLGIIQNAYEKNNWDFNIY